MRLSGQIAIVTGEGRGIGRAIAKQFATEGAHVALVSRTRDELDSLAKEIAKAGGMAKSFVANVSDLEQVSEVVAQVEETIGPIEYEMGDFLYGV